MIKLIVALGNPGVQYETTRHNIGWLCFDQLSFFGSLNWKKKFKGLYAQKQFKDKYVFLMPQTFMNLSGESVQTCAHFYKIQPSEILVVHDEIDLPYGQIMFKQGGGLAGHNGLKSVASQLGTREFFRLRLGVDRPKHGNISSWVLSNFTQEEYDFLGNFLKGSSEALEYCLVHGIEKAQQEFNRKKFV